MSGVIVERPLPDLLATIIDNRGRTCPTSETGVPLIATNCVKRSELFPVLETSRYVDEETYETWFRGHPEPGDILFVCKGDPGRTVFVPDPVNFVIAQDMVALRTDSSKVVDRYLLYALRSDLTQNRILNLHVGTMIPHFKKGDFGKLTIPIHESLAEQHAIAEVLGALDDKIAANTRLAATADELATAMFRFSLMHNSVVVPISELASMVKRGGAPRYVDAGSGAVQVLNQKCVRGKRVNTELGRWTERSRVQSERLLQAGDILVNSTGMGTLGRVARWTSQCEATVDSHITIVRPDALRRDITVVGQAILESETRVESLGEGSTGQTELSRTELEKLEVRIPSPGLDAGLGSKLRACSEMVSAVLGENQTLAETRDALLPKLMSGQLRVRDAERIASEAGA